MLLIDLKCLLQKFSLQWKNLALIFHITADIQYLFHSALCNQLGFTRRVFQHNAHPSAGKIKWYFIYSFIFIQNGFKPLIRCTVDDRKINQVLKTCLKIAVQIRVTQNPHIIISMHIHIFLENNFILC